MKRLDELMTDALSEMTDEDFYKVWTKVKGFEDKKDKHIEYVYQIGDVIDSNAFGGTLVTEEVRERDIERVKSRWKENIKCPLRLNSITKLDENHVPPCYIEYYTEPNPYYGWREEQLEIREYGTNKKVRFKW